MTNYFTDNWDNVQNFQARPDDILIATYPKAGLSQSEVDVSLKIVFGFVNDCVRFPYLYFSLRNHMGLLHSRPAVFWPDNP